MLERAEELMALTEEDYYAIVDEISARYARLAKAGAAELENLTKELKDAWEHPGRELK